MTDINKLPPLEEWLSRNTNEIEEIIAFTKCLFQPGMADLDVAAAEVTQKKAALTGYLIDVCFYLTVEQEEALKSIVEEDGPTAAKVKIESATKGIKRLRDRMKAAVRSLQEMNMNIWGIRKGSK